MRLIRWIVRTCFRISGWKIESKIPPDLKKAVLIGVPHTSNWDLFYTLGLMFTLKLKFRFVIKKEALVFPLKNFLLALGAYPIDRSKVGANSVQQIANVFNENEECILCIAPEGTRKPVKELKSGFIHIAKHAKVPIIVGYLDCSKKIVHVEDILNSNDSENEIILKVKTILKQAVAKKPENFTLLD